MTQTIDSLYEQMHTAEAASAAILAAKEQEIEQLTDTINTTSIERDDIQQKFNSIRLAISAVTTPSTSEVTFEGDDDVALLERGISEPIAQLRHTISEREATIVNLQQELEVALSASHDADEQIKSLEDKIVQLERHVQQVECSVAEANKERVSLEADKAEAQQKVLIYWMLILPLSLVFQYLLSLLLQYQSPLHLYHDIVTALSHRITYTGGFSPRGAQGSTVTAVGSTTIRRGSPNSKE